MTKSLEELFDELDKEAYFNEPWMEVLDPGLLVRYWRHRKSDKILLLTTPSGHTITRRGTPYGEEVTLTHVEAHPIIIF